MLTVNHCVTIRLITLAKSEYYYNISRLIDDMYNLFAKRLSGSGSPLLGNLVQSGRRRRSR